MIPGNLELMEFEHDTPKALMRRAPGDTLFFARIGQALPRCRMPMMLSSSTARRSLVFLTMSALTAATSVLITVHPQMLDVMSMNQFLAMTSDLLEEISKAGASSNYPG